VLFLFESYFLKSNTTLTGK